jgi:transcriptional regulator with GAF, ATPase, and Fis domain
VGSSESIREMLGLVERFAHSDEPVLILGESGTGKELVAKAVHRRSGSARAERGARDCGGRFVAVNCAAVPETLLESELFGHRRGSWTGAVSDREGLFVAADGGTLFLDEVGETSPAFQAKLLRVLQEGEVRPVGGERTRKVDVRVVAATNQDLVGAVRAGTFREDLYYRLAVLTIRVPPLRERCDDVASLARHFLAECVARTGRSPRSLTTGALRVLESHSWPGNVRELENTIRSAHTLCAGRSSLTARDFPELHPRATRAPSSHFGAVQPLDEAERREIRKALAHCGDKVGEAAELLGIHRSTLYRKLARYGMRP